MPGVAAEYEFMLVKDAPHFGHGFY
jgi:hypothetical protein